MLNEALKKVSVIGAGGKMGSGISLLLLQEMARLEAEQTGEIGKGEYRLTLIDTNEWALDSLAGYLRPQMIKYAEKNINQLRSYFTSNKKLVSNEEIVHHFVNGGMDLLRFEDDYLKAKGSKLVFEAIIEDVEIKSLLLKKINEGFKQRDDFLIQYLFHSYSCFG